MSKISDWLTGMVLSFFKKRKKKPQTLQLQKLKQEEGKTKNPNLP